MKVQGAALCERQHLERKVTGLEQQLLALLQQPAAWTRAAVAVAAGLWRFCTTHRAPAAWAAPQSVRSGRLAIGMDSLEPQHRKEQDRPLKRFCRDAGRLDVKDSSRGSVPYRPEPVRNPVGTAMHMASGSEGERTSTGTVAGPDGNSPGVLTGLPAVQATPQTPLQECSSSRAVALSSGDAARLSCHSPKTVPSASPAREGLGELVVRQCCRKRGRPTISHGSCRVLACSAA